MCDNVVIKYLSRAHSRGRVGNEYRCFTLVFTPFSDCCANIMQTVVLLSLHSIYLLNILRLKWPVHTIFPSMPFALRLFTFGYRSYKNHQSKTATSKFRTCGVCGACLKIDTTNELTVTVAIELASIHCALKFHQSIECANTYFFIHQFSLVEKRQCVLYISSIR